MVWSQWFPRSLPKSTKRYTISRQMKRWCGYPLQMRKQVDVYMHPDAYLSDRNQRHCTQAKVHYGSTELVPGRLGPSDRRVELWHTCGEGERVRPNCRVCSSFQILGSFFCWLGLRDLDMPSVHHGPLGHCGRTPFFIRTLFFFSSMHYSDIPDTKSSSNFRNMLYL